jgi:uncharacterized protein YkwD
MKAFVILSILLGQWFATTPDKFYARLDRLYQSNMERCRKVALKKVRDKELDEVSYLFLSKIHYNRALNAPSKREVYRNLNRSLSYGYRVHRYAQLDKILKEWAKLYGELDTLAQSFLADESISHTYYSSIERKTEKLGMIILDEETASESEAIPTVLTKDVANKTYFGLPSGAENIPMLFEGEEQEMLRIINQARKAKGLNTLEWDKDLSRAARYHAFDMATQHYFSHATHDRINGKLEMVDGAFKRIRKFYTTGFVNSENIAAGNKTAEATYKQWYNSKGHYENMFRASSKKVGIGVYYDPESPYGYYWVFCTALN